MGCSLKKPQLGIAAPLILTSGGSLGACEELKVCLVRLAAVEASSSGSKPDVLAKSMAQRILTGLLKGKRASSPEKGSGGGGPAGFAGPLARLTRG